MRSHIISAAVEYLMSAGVDPLINRKNNIKKPTRNRGK